MARRIFDYVASRIRPSDGVISLSVGSRRKIEVDLFKT
jgi:hypothetical protein